jgi:hypothetical protein
MINNTRPGFLSNGAINTAAIISGAASSLGYSTSDRERAMAIFEGPDRNRNIMIIGAALVIAAAVIIFFYTTSVMPGII